jgi:tRNA/rRNA methyltransferase
MPSPSPLDNLSIILVHTKTPGNIGAVCRSMMNMGLSRLMLVRPPDDLSGEAMKFAAGAEEILKSAKIFPTLEEAVADHHLVIGTSRHLGRRRKNVTSPRRMAEEVLPLLANNKVAVVFGREVNGLDKDDLALCHELIAIPSSDAFPSLNLSHAVIVIAYELFLASLEAAPDFGQRELAPDRDIEAFYRQLQDTLEDAGFLNAKNADHMMFSLRQLFGRARLDTREVNILRGILTEKTKVARSGKRK